MIKFYTITFFILISIITQAQTYEFSLSYIGINNTTDNHQMALVATPNTMVTNESTEDMGAGFYVPQGVALGNFETGNSGIPGSEWTSASLSNTSNAYFLSRVEAGSSSVLLNGNGPFQLVIFDIIATPNPNSGEIKFVENGDPVFNELLFIENYMNISSSNKYQQNDATASSVNFSTLSSMKSNFKDISVYPNPTKGVFYVKGEISKIKSIEVFSITGKKVMDLTKGFNVINITKLESSIYFVKLNTETTSKTYKIVKE